MSMRTRHGQTYFRYNLIEHISQAQNSQAISILDKDNPFNSVDSSGQTLLHYVVFYKNATIARYLVNTGCDVDVPNCVGITALMLAVDLRDRETIAVLLSAKANIFARSPGIQSPLQIALTYQSLKDIDIARTFLELVEEASAGDSEAMANLLIQHECPLPRAILTRDLAVVQCMLRAKKDEGVQERDSNDDTALHYAVRCMDFEIVQLLIECGADVNAVNQNRQTPLHLYDIDIEETYEILRIFLDNGASLTAQDDNGFMVATQLLRYGGVKLVEILLQYDVDLFAKNDDDTTLLHHLAFNKNDGVVELLQGRPFDVNAVDLDGRTALWNAVECTNVAVLEFLLRNGADVNYVDMQGYTALFHGFYAWIDMPQDKANWFKCLELFIEYGADVEFVGADQETLFDIALESNNIDMIKPILAHLAMREAVGHFIQGNIHMMIDTCDILRKYFQICQRKIQKIRKTVIYEKVTLFMFLVEPRNKLLMYARNNETVLRLQRILHRERHSRLYFIKILRRRAKEIIQIANLRRGAAATLQAILSLGYNTHVIDHIILYLDNVTLQNLCNINL